MNRIGFVISTRVPKILLAAAAMATFLATTASAQDSTTATPSPVAHVSGFIAPQADVLSDGSVVVTFTATGDLKGLVTLTLHPGAGSAYAGTWGFTVQHVENTDPVTGEDVDYEDGLEALATGQPDVDVPGGPPVYFALIDQGSLTGVVTNAVVSFDAAGKLADVSATLTIASGTKEFAGATGTGQATVSGLNLIF
jgi:hypothetical protein